MFSKLGAIKARTFVYIYDKKAAVEAKPNHLSIYVSPWITEMGPVVDEMK